jgi:hypothetical protein
VTYTEVEYRIVRSGRMVRFKLEAQLVMKKRQHLPQAYKMNYIAEDKCLLKATK